MTLENKTQILLSKNLKYLRECCELTQQQIADDLHIDRSTYTYWELGTTMPSVHKVTALIDFYRKRNIRLDYNLLLDGLITSSVMQGIKK